MPTQAGQGTLAAVAPAREEPEVAELVRKLLGSRVRTVSSGPIAYLTPDAES
jgi:hypothetical protein